jgi:hypothetical protein
MRLRPQSVRVAISPFCLKEPAAEEAAIAVILPLVCFLYGRQRVFWPYGWERMASILRLMRVGHLSKSVR